MKRIQSTKWLFAIVCLSATGFFGYIFGTIQANRRTLCRAMDVIDTIKTPVDNLNAQDAIAIVAASATPRWRQKDGPWEQYKSGAWVNTSEHWEKR